jgi:hypothetical protein
MQQVITHLYLVYTFNLQVKRANIKTMDQYTNKLEKIRRAPYFSWLILFLISGLICLAALRHNNTTMIGLRNDVYAADKANANIEGALDKLRAYVYGHMNTNLSTGNGVNPARLHLRQAAGERRPELITLYRR